MNTRNNLSQSAFSLKQKDPEKIISTDSERVHRRLHRRQLSGDSQNGPPSDTN